MKKIKCICKKKEHLIDLSIPVWAFVQETVDKLGENTEVTVIGKGIWRIPRFYIAIHGLKGASIETLGFKKIK